MTTTAHNSAVRRSSRPFFTGLAVVVLSLVAVGAGGFWYLTASGPLTLLAGGDRPIAAATVFVPAQSPLTISLLTRPERIVAFEQAVVDPDQRRQARREIDQLKQSLFDNTQIDYDRDIRPWIGNEITFALTDRDLEADRAGQQPGYLTLLEIAPERQRQAREFLQLFWQRQSLVSGPLRSERASGVRLLYADGPSPAVASALVGSQFVIFANDIRVLRRSVQVAQTAANLAQNRAYRETVDQLPPERIGLAYVDTVIARDIGRSVTQEVADTAPSQFAAINFSITTSGLVAKARLTEPVEPGGEGRALSEPVEALAFLPADTTLAVVSTDLGQLAPSLADAGLPSSLLPDFLRLTPATDQATATASLWDWATTDYALGQVTSGKQTDWILAVLRDTEGIAHLDEAANDQGYSAVPVAIGEQTAIAWTRFKARSRHKVSDSLEAEVLGLHLQQDSYEIFASSVAAMEAALSAPQRSLLDASRFTEAIAPLAPINSGYFYADLMTILQQPTATVQALPLLTLVESAARPLVRHIDTLVATRSGATADLSIQLRQARSDQHLQP